MLIAGDGGFMLHVGELVTLVQHSLPVVICLFNDRGYGVLRGIEARQFDGRNFGVDLTTPDFPALAQSMGVHAARVATPAEFEARFARRHRLGRPVPARRRPDRAQPARPALAVRPGAGGGGGEGGGGGAR